MSTYRRDIDGLRMIAIVPVVLYHAGVPWLTGGYVGVDVFFVISGFLITGILHRELTQERFSLIEFYERRVRRIIPALTAVILASFIAGFLILSPGQYFNFSWSVITTALFSSNFWFLSNTSDYFASEAEFEPLLHAWSLAVEEQFYVLFPLLLWVLLRWPKKVTVWTVGALSALSLLLAIMGVAWRPSMSFYLAPTRGWELGLGALLALGFRPSLTAPWLREVVAIAGLAAILIAVFFYDASTPFPGFSALLPCLGAAAIILAGTQGQSLTSRLLSIKPFVFVGLISYSLYLWHWPILTYLRLYTGDVTLPPLLSAGAVVSAFIAAIFSWAYIERPFRRRPPRGFRRAEVFGFAGIGTAGVIVLALGIIVSAGFPGRLPPAVVAAYAGMDDVSPDKERCFGVWPDAGLCRFGATTNSQMNMDYLLWGDSHALSMMPGVGAAAREARKSGLFAGRSSCPPLLGVKRADLGPHDDCARFNAAIFKLLEERSDIRQVILAARWALSAESNRLPGEHGKPAFLAWAYDGEPESGSLLPQHNIEIFEHAIKETVAAIRATGRKVIILGNVPEIGWNVPRRLGGQLRWGVDPPPAPTIESVSLRNGRAEAILSEIADQPDVDFLELTGLFCDPICHLTLDGRPLYADDDHLSNYGSVKIIGPLFLREVWR